MSKKTIVLLSAVSLVVVLAALAAQILLKGPGEPQPSDPALSEESVPFDAPPLADIDSGGVSLHSRAVDPYFYREAEEGWTPVYLKGVNMGLTEATTDLASPDVSYETYREWLSLIDEMNANTVRVFTVMPPQFYRALSDHNAAVSSPLYLVQGIWFNETYMTEGDHAFEQDGRTVKAFKRAVRETLDIVHGNSDYTDYGEIKNAVYSYDVSPYLAGYILGLEWDPGFVKRTNAQTSHAGYTGHYLKTAENATAFESFLCEAGDYLIAYETEIYSAQTPVAFLNWQTTDTLSHSNEPFEEEDMVSVDTEAICPTDRYYCGLFAAVDVYPYYPEFMNYQPEYLQADETGDVNPYKAYLADLRTQYSVPVIVAEFGAPTSRGTAHRSVMGIHQGGLTEQQQGEAIVKMMESIASEGYAGSLIFSWQDEWFKQTWNTYRYSPDNAAVRTPNVQSAEQSYGLLAMEPGETDICHIDGLADEWQNVSPTAESAVGSVSALWDEGYLYLKLECPGVDFDRDTLLIPIQITGTGSSFCGEYDVSFDGAADFLLVLNGKEDTRLLTDAYEDLFYFTYAYENGLFERNERFEQKNSGLYNPIRQFLSNEISLPETGETIGPQYSESGLLTYGITDPDSPAYNSLADFYYQNGVAEVRIPWYLLNVMNSTLGVCLNDFYTAGGVDVSDMPGVRLGIGTPGGKNIPLHDIGYAPREQSYFHTRLKKSYAIVQKAMENFMEY